jgi:urease accessory protein
MDSEVFVGLLQFADGLLPVGSYAHSWGLESYASAATIRDAVGVERFILAHLHGSLAPTDVVAMLGARRSGPAEASAALERCLTIDHTLDAMKAASETRDASRQMGRQVLRIAANLGQPSSSNACVAELFRMVENAETPGHHAVAFGSVGAAFGWIESEMACAYLYSSCAGLVAAALRLLPLGQLAGQRILWNLRPAIAQLAEEALSKEMADVWSFAPGLEIAAMRHATLDARLFRS